MNYKQVAEELIALSGGSENITTYMHCATRLRFYTKDKNKIQQAKIKAVKGVLGLVFVGEELQIVLGKNVNPVYEEASRLIEISHSKQSDVIATRSEQLAKPKQKRTVKGIFTNVIGFISAVVTPMIPGLVAGGMLKVFLLLFRLAIPSFGETQVYSLLGLLSDVPFFFMPVFVAYGAAKKLGATPIFSMVVAATLVYPNFTEFLKSNENIEIMQIPVMVVKYSGSLLPALLIGLCAYYVEKFMTKILPGIVRPILLGISTMVITYILGITILGPFGDFIGSYMVNIFLWSSENLGTLSVGLLSACMPWLVMTGMHHAVTPFMVQAIANPGYDMLFRPAYLLHNMAEGGACLGVALRTKNKALRTESLSLAVGCIVAGVTEPAIYGINLPLRNPMFGVMAGAASGGVVAGLFGATAYVYGYSTILAIPIFQHTVMAIIAAIITAIIVAMMITAILGFDEKNLNH
ncbi:PTS beta-glucoside transporter subunit IIABC [Chelonobacter oris]|uniref:PTS beta-glucoside transporter subunit IIABC n=1 Tax=Chelonobacter oris TaxID=505317 RepID=A0A0A3AJB2_9PAST|nr:PTS transporter subunit EIIC [Chelonobacter oris]KGQ69493.1 PTS beta-glucoside transporter subunit IIABC [Chelonobacter oris]